jgi:hypothetical protein
MVSDQVLQVELSSPRGSHDLFVAGIYLAATWSLTHYDARCNNNISSAADEPDRLVIFNNDNK